MKILVSGGAGFIGSNFILYWAKTHPEDFIVNIDKLTYAGNLENLATLEKNPHYHFIHGDICDSRVVAQAMEGIDTVVHFAAESHVDRSILEPAPFITTNVVGTQVLLDAAVKANIRKFHHISTDEVFGPLELDDTFKFTELSKYDPRSPYAASKASSDHLVRAYYYTFGLPVTISNCSNNFGPFQFPEKFIPLTITQLIERKKVPIYGDGLYVRDWLYVEDHCEAIDSIITGGKAGETYCVGGMTEDINNLQVVKKILKYMNKDESLIEFIKDRPGHDRRYAIDWSKINRELGWKPKYNFDTCLKSTVQWYIDHESWWKSVKNGSYQLYYEKQHGVKQ